MSIPSILMAAFASVGGTLLVLVVFAAVMVALSRPRTPDMVFGLMRVLYSTFAAPTHYLRRLAGDLADLGQRGESVLEHRGLYLLHKVLDIQKAILMLFTCTILASGAIYAWNALVPERAIRDAHRSVKSELISTTTELESVEAEIQTSSASSTTRLAAALEGYRKPRLQAVTEATAALDRLAGEMRSSSEQGVLLEFMTAEVARIAPSSPEQIERLHRTLRYRMAAATWAGGSEGPLVQWIDTWKQRAMVEAELATAPATVQAEESKRLAELSASATKLRKDLEALRRQETDLKAQLHLRWGGFVGAVGLVVAVFLAVVWILGLLAEAVGSWIELAGDVREMRTRLHQEQQAERQGRTASTTPFDAGSEAFRPVRGTILEP